MTGGSGKPADRWAHRRGEPRVFALLLSVYLLLGALTTVLASSAVGEPAEATLRRGAGMLLLIVALMVSVVWPMVRLSQASPANPARAALADWAVVALLGQAVIWPLTLLPGGAMIRPVPWPGLWPWSVCAGLGLSSASWALLIGALVGLGTRSRSRIGRAVWMLGIVAVNLAGPALRWALASAPGASLALSLSSPITAGGVLVSAPSGVLPSVSGVEWAATLAPALAGLPLWGLARRQQ